MTMRYGRLSSGDLLDAAQTLRGGRTGDIQVGNDESLATVPRLREEAEPFLHPECSRDSTILSRCERLALDEFRCSTGTSGRPRRRSRTPPAQSLDCASKKSGRPGSNRRRPAWEKIENASKTRAALGFRGLPCPPWAPGCPPVRRRTATRTATRIELPHRLVKMRWGQVGVPDRHGERLVPHQLADRVQVAAVASDRARRTVHEIGAAPVLTGGIHSQDQGSHWHHHQATTSRLERHVETRVATEQDAPPPHWRVPWVERDARCACQ